MKLYCWNVNGIRAAAKKGFLDWMASVNPDVLCVQETKASVEQLDEELIRPLGYHAHWHSAVRKGYSGVATFSKTPPVHVEAGLGIEEFDCEGRVLMTEFSSFMLFNIYFPNSQRGHDRLQYKLRFCDALLKHLDTLRKKGKQLVICGDFNVAHNPIDLARPKENEQNAGFLPEERDWMTKFLGRGYVDVFRSLNPEAAGAYTWWSYQFNARQNNVGWRVDYHCVTPELMSAVRAVRHLPDVMGSDHCPIALELSANGRSTPVATRRRA